ncbi:MAG: hypothetical protein HFG45_07890 [Oscillospiraceae bacterium]|nr:hypothetical protein [Oscillospiraceae bacterium]
MPEELHTNLKVALAYDKSSFTELFNKAAEEYLSSRNSDVKRKTEDNNRET